MIWKRAGYDLLRADSSRRQFPRMEKLMLFLLWILAVILVVSGIVQLFKGQMLWGIVLIVVGFAVGPGGYSIFR